MTIQSIESYYLLHCPQATQIAEEPHTQANTWATKSLFKVQISFISARWVTNFTHILFTYNFSYNLSYLHAAIHQLQGSLMQLIYCTTSKVCYKIFEEATLSGHGVSTVSKLSGRTQQRRRRRRSWTSCQLQLSESTLSFSLSHCPASAT